MILQTRLLLPIIIFCRIKLPDGTPGAQYFFEIQQLIKTAGKRGKLIAAAQTNANISGLQLQDVMRKFKKPVAY